MTKTHLTTVYQCEKCGHKWASNSSEQTKCSKCDHKSDDNVKEFLSR